MNVLIGILAGVLCGLLFAVKDVFSKKAIEKTGFAQALFYIYFIAWLPVAVYFVLFDYHAFSLPELQLGAFVGLGLAIGYFLFFKAMQAGKVSLAGPVAELWVVFAVIASFFFLGETISLLQAAGLALSLLALFLISKRGKTELKSVLYALAAAVVWGGSWFMVKPLADAVGVIPSYVLYVGIGTALFFAYLLYSKKWGFPEKSVFLPAFVLVCAYLIEVWGISLSTVSLVSIAYAPVYVLCLIVLTRVVLKEKLQKIHYAGIGLILAALLLIAVG